jgi:hypothetical protein
MTTEQYIKARLATWAMKEAAPWGGDNLNCMLGMAFVIRNRVRAGWHGGDWLAVIEHSDDAAARIAPPYSPNLRVLTVKQFLQQVDDIYSGELRDDISQGGVYYAELDNIEQEWFLEKICRDSAHHPRVGQIAQMVLFA